MVRIAPSPSEAQRVLRIGRSADALVAWLAREDQHRSGVSGYRPLGQAREHGSVTPGGEPDPEEGAQLAGLDAIELSAHGLQSGYLSETVRRGIPLVEAMQQSQHRSVQQAARYYNEVERQRERAARVI